MSQKPWMVGCVLTGMCLMLLCGGCASGSTDLLPSADKGFSRPKKQMMADAAKRTYPADAPHQGEAPMRAEVDYALHVINVVNFSPQAWDNVEVWVNGEFACQVTTLPVKKQLGVNFEALYNKQGQQAPLHGVWIKNAQLVADGKIYDLTLHLPD